MPCPGLTAAGNDGQIRSQAKSLQGGFCFHPKSNDTIAIRSMQHFTLAFDHHLIAGAGACKFMLELKRVLESWNQEIG